MTMNSGVVSGLATVVAQTMDTLQDSLVRAILNGLATTMKIVSVVSALNFGKLADYISHASLVLVLLVALKYGWKLCYLIQR